MSKESTIPVTDAEAPGRPQPGDPEAPASPAEAPDSEAAVGEAVGSAGEATAGDGVGESPDGADEAARREIERLGDEVLRLRAEMENLRRRSAREVEKAHKYGVERLVNELLPVKDSMELGLAAAGPGAEIEKVRDGLALTLRLMATALEKFGLEEIDPAGEPFDPEFHEAMTMQPSADLAPNSVLEVFQKGYLLSGRLVRPAKVVVARAPQDG